MEFEKPTPLTEEQKENVKSMAKDTAKLYDEGADVRDDGSLGATEQQIEDAREEMGEVRLWRLSENEIRNLEDAYADYGEADASLREILDNTSSIISKSALEELAMIDFGSVLEGEEEEERKKTCLNILHQIKISE